jgi:putative transposase
MVFSTKHRMPVLSPQIRTELFPYLATVLTSNESPSLQVGGFSDHVHLFFGLSRKMTIARIAEMVKTSSSKWIKTKGPQFREFHWQGGYAAFSVSESGANAVARYIKRQDEHHRRRSFQDELRASLNRYRIPFDERYVWD